MMFIPPYAPRAVSGDVVTPTPGTEDNETEITVRASAQWYLPVGNPVPAAWGEPAGNQWPRLTIGVNGTYYGAPQYVTAKYWADPREWVDLVFIVPVARASIHSVQLKYDNDWGAPGPYTGAVGTDRNVAVDFIRIDSNGTPLQLYYSSAVYVQTGAGTASEAAAKDVSYVNGYYDWRNIHGDLGNEAPTDTPWVQQANNKTTWRGGELKRVGITARRLTTIR